VGKAIVVRNHRGGRRGKEAVMEIIIAIAAVTLIIGIACGVRKAKNKRAHGKSISDKARLAEILTETSGFYSVKHLSEIGRLGIR
jgi:hypothetical protein